MRKLVILTFSLLFFGSIYAQRNAGDLYPGDSIFFEFNTIPYSISGTFPSNIWQVGHPSKSYFNQAYSPPQAILTDTINPYPVNNESSFSFMIIDTLNHCCAPYFEIKHKFDTDTLTDLGLIEYSFDNGVSWALAKDSIGSAGPYGMFIFGWPENSAILPPHHNGGIPWQISGRSDGWILSRYVWQFLFPVKNIADTIPEYPDTIMVRFTFKSDDIQTNKEGWMIDNIVTGQMDVGTGVAELTIPAEISPNPLIDHATVRTSPGFNGASFTMYDDSGKCVLKDKLNSNGDLIIYRNDLKPGVYLWRILSGNRSGVGKLIVAPK